jgi:transcription termination factor NusB
MEKKTINLEDILHNTKFEELSNIEKDLIRCGVISYNVKEIVNAMREACRQTLELAAENAETYEDPYEDVWVNKQSILETIKQIE